MRTNVRKRAFAGIVAGQVVALERAGEELLRQILRVLGVAPPAQPDVNVDRAPVAARKRIERGRAPHRIVAAQIADDRMVEWLGRPHRARGS